jgi:hypothetical protein
MGVAGSGAARSVVIIAGLAGLVAGALWMALGEYLSVQSTRELFARELEIEAHELETDPAAEVDELCAIYERKASRARRLTSWPSESCTATRGSPSIRWRARNWVHYLASRNMVGLPLCASNPPSVSLATPPRPAWGAPGAGGQP